MPDRRSSRSGAQLSPAELRQEVQGLGWWYHNIDLGDGVLTSPNHPDGDHPQNRFDFVAPFLPADLSGKSVLDIGCNGGFFSLELKRRGASRVLGIDYSSSHIDQARFAAGHLGLDIEYRQMDCYDLDSLDEQFDVVVFFGVMYHLRHPLLALDLIRSRCREMMLFQTVTYDLSRPIDIPDDIGPVTSQPLFRNAGFPRLMLVENRFNGDPTNWWIGNRNGILALLRTAGFQSAQETAHPEIFLVYPDDGPPGASPLAGLESRSRHVAPGRLRRTYQGLRQRAAGRRRLGDPGRDGPYSAPSDVSS